MVARKDIKNKYDIFRSISKILVILVILDLSQTAQAQQWERVFGDVSPGIRITGERPSCWFSPSHRLIETPYEIAVDNVQYNSFGQVVEYYIEGIANGYPIKTHIYDGTYNSFGQVSGFKEDRNYTSSGNAYHITVAGVTYDSFGNVKDGYPVTVNQNTLPIPSKNISDYVSHISIGQIWDYGDPTDNTDLVYEFYLIIRSYRDTSMNMNTSVDSVEFLTPAGNTFRIPKLPGKWSDGIWKSYQYSEYLEYNPNMWFENAVWEYRARLTDLADLKAYGDGEYTITLHYTDGSKSQTPAWFGIPNTNDPIPQPTQEPVITIPLHNQTVESPVTFTWEPCTDPNTEFIYFDVDELGTAWIGYRVGIFDVNETSWGPVYLPDGFWDVELFFHPGPWNGIWFDRNSDGISVGTLKYSTSRYRFTTVEGFPWTKYEVWGSNTLIDWSEGSYGNIADLEANEYVKLGESDGQTATFSGQYEYYLITTVGKFLLDSIQGSDGSYYSSFEFNDDIINTYDEDNLLGPPDGQCAVVGMSNPLDDYSGYFVFTNPGNWEGLTVFTSDLNLNLSKSVVGTVDEIENIDPNDTITYRICFDSNDFTQDITDITVVDILPDEVSFVLAENNELSGTYDPDKHTYTWSYPSLAPESAIEMQLTVLVNPDVAPGTTITNFATINSKETPPSTTSVNFMVAEPIPPFTSDLNLNLSKSIVSTVYESGNINPNETFTYGIYFDSNDFVQDVTDITVVDILPDEVSFVSADGNEVSGTYDPDKHTYTWSYPSLVPESAIEMQLIVQVNPDVAPGTIITNFATINSKETPPSTTSVNFMVAEPIPPLRVDNLSIIPNELRRNGTSPNITAVVQLPEGIKQSDIDPNDRPELYYQERNTNESILIGKGSLPVLSGTEDRPTITVNFSRPELMNAVQYYGEVWLKIEGKLKEQSYYGYAIIYITRFAGD